LLGSQLSDE
jgi:hypothetical protein